MHSLLADSVRQDVTLADDEAACLQNQGPGGCKCTVSPKRTAGTYSALTKHGVLAAASGLVALTLSPANVGTAFTSLGTGKLNAALDTIFPSEQRLDGKAEFLAVLGEAFILEVQTLRTRMPPQTPQRAPAAGAAPGSAVGAERSVGEEPEGRARNRFPAFATRADTWDPGDRFDRQNSLVFSTEEVTPTGFFAMSQKMREGFFKAVLHVARKMDRVAGVQEEAAEQCVVRDDALTWVQFVRTSIDM